MTIKVLVVDATNVTERLARDTLIPLGCQIIRATSTALGIFLARKNFPSLIINGISATDEIDLPQDIHADPELSHIPIVLVANNAGSDLVAKAKAAGATKVLAHPLTVEGFFEELRPFLVETEDDRPAESPE